MQSKHRHREMVKSRVIAQVVPQAQSRSTLLYWFIILLFSVLLSMPSMGDMGLRKKIKIQKRSYFTEVTQPQSEFDLGKLELLAKKRRNLIQDIKRFLGSARSRDQKAELNLRLAALYMEDYRAQLITAEREYDQKYEAWQKLPKKKKGPAPKMDNTEALASLKRATVLYQESLERYPKHPRRDEILFFMAASSLDQGNQGRAIRYFEELSSKHPKSKYINDALVELGDYYFEREKFAKALGYYDRLIKSNYESLLSYATYKKAWCSYNTGKIKDSLKQFKWVIERGEHSDAPSSLRIKREALRDIVFPFVDLEQVKPAIQFFRTKGEKVYRTALENMASMYSEHAKYDRAISLWATLLRVDPNHPKAPNYDLHIVEAYRSQDKHGKAVDRLFSRLPNYIQNSTWYEINSADVRIAKSARDQFEAIARKYAFQYHASAQKTKNDKEYNVAKRLYSRYLQHFPNTSEAAKIRFYMAEILYTQEKYRDAAKHYHLVYTHPNAGNLRFDAIKYALASLALQFNLDRKKKGLEDIRIGTKTKLKASIHESEEDFIPYSEVEQDFIKMAKVFLTQYPKSKEAPDALYQHAYLEYSHRDFAQSYKTFWKFIRSYPKHASSYTAAHLILDILNRKKNYKNLAEAARRFLRLPELKNKQFRAEVSTILRQAQLKEISLLEEKRKYKQAALGYLEYTKEFGPQDEALFEKALYNAAVNFNRASLHLRAVETQEQFLRRFPQSSLKRDMTLQVAKSYEQMAQFGKAAIYFESFANTYPSHQASQNALRLAGLYYLGDGKFKNAEKTMRAFRVRYPKKKALINEDLEDLYTAQANDRQLIAFYNQLRNERSTSKARYAALSYKIAQVQAKTSPGAARKTAAAALSTARRFSSQVRATEEGKEAYARLWFWETQSKEKDFYRIQLKLPESKMAANLNRKMALLKQLEADYQNITKLGIGEWGIASVYKTAIAYRHLAETVSAAPIPSELDAKQVEQYRTEINKSMITPFTEKALSLVVQCLDKSQELNLLSSWTSQCYNLASKLQPQRYPKVRTFYLPAAYTALLLPSKSKSKIKIGKIKGHPLPLYSSQVFEPSRKPRSLASLSPIGIPNHSASATYDFPNSIPIPTSYSILEGQRLSILKKSLAWEKPGKRKPASFSYLNLIRVMTPKKAIAKIRLAIERDPKNVALHNLLALSYLELNDYSSAKVILFSLIARGFKKPSIWNNLGVIALRQSREEEAISYFQNAIKLRKPVEALINMGFIALKYHNGFEAKKRFKRALEYRKSDPTILAGLASAQLQNREFDSPKKSLPILMKKHAANPYIRLLAAYMYMDVSKKYRKARHILGRYINDRKIQNNLLFRQAYLEAKGEKAGSLPKLK